MSRQPFESRWRVYYDDGSTWDWTQGLDGIPPHGVICILQVIEAYDSKGNLCERYQRTHGCPYYMRADNEWLHAYENDVIDRLSHRMPIEIVLVGRMVTRRQYAEVHAQSVRDYDAENL